MQPADVDAVKVLVNSVEDPQPIPPVAEEEMRWIQDPLGFFTIKAFPEEQVVKIRFYEYSNDERTEWKKRYLFEVKNTKTVYHQSNTSMIIQQIYNMGLISRLEHAAYLGKEIERALLSLKYNFDYIQN